MAHESEGPPPATTLIYINVDGRGVVEHGVASNRMSNPKPGLRALGEANMKRRVVMDWSA
jgi:hypothetical protein